MNANTLSRPLQRKSAGHTSLWRQRHTWRRALTAAAALLGLLLLLGACSEQPRQPVGRLDTPEHHTLRGNDFLAQGDWKEAQASFAQALSLNAAYAPALAGRAVVEAHEATNPGLAASARKDQTEKAEDTLDAAESNARDDQERLAVHIAGIRVYQLAKPDDWLDDAEDHYNDAVKLDKNRSDPRPYFYMARAYRDSFDLGRAGQMYRQVLSMNRGLTGEADRELALTQQIERAAPGTVHGKAVAFAETISRADVAALFVEELQLARLYNRDGSASTATGFRPPQQQQFQTERMQKAPDVTDIEEHPLRADIRQVIDLGVSGLQPDPSHKFHPDEKISRAEFAIMVQDILARVTGEQGLKTRYVGQASPFRDVRADLPYFNAVQTMVNRNLMAPKDSIRGLFAPTEPLTGADALLVIRLLKNELRSYLRS
jgi:Tfp pilus assembly protein PilF